MWRIVACRIHSFPSPISQPGILHQAIGEGNYEELAFAAHTIKGISGNILAPQVVKAAEKVEKRAREHDKQAFILAEALLQLLERLLVELNNFDSKKEYESTVI